MRKHLMTIGLSVFITLFAVGVMRWQPTWAHDAQPMAGGTPGLISHQGFLSETDGTPVSDGSYPMHFGIYTAVSGGTKIWEETHNSVPVSAGFFAVMLGQGACNTGCPLGPETFADPTRYLQTSVDTGSGFVDFPRQQLGAVPYAMQAAAVPWSGVIDPPSFGGGYQNVLIVALSGGDFTSVAAALASISDAAVNNRYLVWVAPGVYTESNLVEVPGYVHLQGSGPQATVVQSSRSAGTPGSNAATINLLENSAVSDLTVYNSGTGTFGIAVYSTLISRTTIVNNVVAEANGSGTGGGRYAIYLNDAAPTIKNSSFKAYGATGFGTAVNAGLGSVNISSGFPQALILNSIFLGGATSTVQECHDNSGTGFGMQLSESTPDIRHSHICGGHRGIALLQNGHPRIENSEIRASSTGSAFLFEISAAGSISVANSGIAYVGNKFTGAGTGLRCVHNFAWGNWTPLSNGTTTGTACN